MSHAHPLQGSWEGLLSAPNFQHCASPSQLSTHSAPSTPQTTSLLQDHKPLNRQSHLLRLRNAGFRGSSIPTIDSSRISPTASTPPNPHAYSGSFEGDAAVSIQERSGGAVKSSRASPLGILQEIQNNTNRRRSAIKPDGETHQLGSTTILQENRFGSLGSLHTERSWSPYSGKQFGSPDNPRAQKTIWEPSTLATDAQPQTTKSSKEHKTDDLQVRYADFEATKYIEHLETQLDSTQRQLQSFTSQSATKTQTNRLRALSSESRSLRAEVLEWESRFNDRIKSELEDRVRLESGLRSRIKFLEKEKDVKDDRIRELEDQVGSLQNVSNELHTMQSENEMLKQRLHAISIAVVSPSNGSDDYDCSKPPLESPTANKGQSTMLGLDSISSSPVDVDFESAPLSALRLQQARLSTETECPTCGSFMASSQDSSTCFSRSRPNSMTSTYSYSPSMGDSCQPSQIASRNRSSSQRRRMRRFSSGSSGPKTLLLPNSAVTAGGPTSAPPELSPKPWDETTPRPKAHSRLRLSMQDVRTPFGSPLNVRRDSPSWNDATTLASLEANSTPPNPWHHSPALGDLSLDSILQLTDVNLSQRKRQGRPQSLFAELSKARASAQKNDRFSAAEAIADTASRNIRQSFDEKGENKIEGGPAKSQECSIKPSSPGHRPVTIGDSQLGFAELWCDPIALSKRVVANAWHQGSRSRNTSDLVWWLIGLLLGPIQTDERRRRNKFHRGALESRSPKVSSKPKASCELPEDQNVQNELNCITARGGEFVTGACRDCAEAPADAVWPWVKLTAALVFAVGISLRDGPGALVCPTELNGDPPKENTALIEDPPS